MPNEKGRLSRKETQERTRQSLIDAAAVAFRRDGFHGASLESIAADAGFTRGAVYANFDGKEGLFLAMIEAEMMSRFSLFTDNLTYENFAEVYLQSVDADPEWSLALAEFSVHAARTPELRDRLIERNRRLTELVAEAGRAAYPDLSEEQAESAARFILVLQTGVGIERALDPDSIRYEDILGPLRVAGRG